MTQDKRADGEKERERSRERERTREREVGKWGEEAEERGIWQKDK